MSIFLLVFAISQCVATTTIPERVWVVERYFRLQGTECAAVW
jgi:hypothetical protein